MYCPITDKPSVSTGGGAGAGAGCPVWVPVVNVATWTTVMLLVGMCLYRMYHDQEIEGSGLHMLFGADNIDRGDRSPGPATQWSEYNDMTDSQLMTELEKLATEKHRPAMDLFSVMPWTVAVAAVCILLPVTRPCSIISISGLLYMVLIAADQWQQTHRVHQHNRRVTNAMSSS